MNDGKPVVEFGMELKGSTREERELEYNLNWEKAHKAVDAGQTICISDLMCQAEQLHMEPRVSPPKSKRLTRLEKLVASLPKAP